MSRSTWASGVGSQYCSLYRGAVAHHVSDGAIGHEQQTIQQLPNVRSVDVRVAPDDHFDEVHRTVGEQLMILRGCQALAGLTMSVLLLGVAILSSGLFLSLIHI